MAIVMIFDVPGQNPIVNKCDDKEAKRLLNLLPQGTKLYKTTDDLLPSYHFRDYWVYDSDRSCLVVDMDGARSHCLKKYENECNRFKKVLIDQYSWACLIDDQTAISALKEKASSIQQALATVDLSTVSNTKDLLNYPFPDISVFL